MNCEISFQGLTANVGESKKVKSFGRFLAPSLSVFSGMSSKLDQSCLVRVEFQAKLGHPFPQGVQTESSFYFAAKTYYKIVCIADDNDSSSRCALPPIFDPKV
jgi:hypothetical protein